VRWLSGLPGLPINRGEGRWVSRDGVVRYLERYARHHDLEIRTGFEVERVIRHDGGWRLRTSQGEMHAHHLVVATGFNREPFLPDWPGREGFTGDLLHSAAYRSPSPYRGKDVLVVGTGNSGAEIAVDLIEGRARLVMISVRTRPISFAATSQGFPPRS
jgi:putative flavoprotein involved in K+ transport